MPKRPFNTQRFLAGVPLFRALGKEGAARVAAGAVRIDPPRGATLYRRGDPCSGLYVVVSGQVKLILGAHKGVEKVLELAGPRQILGESELFLDSPRVLEAKALTDARLLHIARETMLSEFEREPALGRLVIAVLSHRLHRVLSDVESYSLRSGAQRVIGYLLSRLPRRAAKRAATITLPASKRVIASRLNLSQAHFSRILRGLAEAGLIRVKGRLVTVMDAAAMRGHPA